MTERCQTKFTERFENQNYVIYMGIVVASVAVLFVYRFHFATIAFSYVLGCVACYYGLNSDVLNNLVSSAKWQAAPSGGEEAARRGADAQAADCATCGSSSCARHDAAAGAEPWAGLQVHKQLDDAIDKFYSAVLEQFVVSWHSRLRARPHFPHELRVQLRRASALLLRRALKVNYGRFLTERVIPCALRHYTCWAESGAEPDPRRGAGQPAVHPAAASRAAELKYLRSLAAAALPLLLDGAERDDPVLGVLLREVVAGWVLQPLTDVLADPYILNALVVLATGGETMAELPDTPDYTVEFLAAFVSGAPSRRELARARRLGAGLERALADPPHLYAFMHFLKPTPHLRLLQFYKDIKHFQLRLLNPALGAAEQAALVREGAALLARAPRPPGADRGADEDDEREPDIKSLQTSAALFAAAHAARAQLHDQLLPRFLHSDEFYKLLIGSRMPTGYQKQYKRQVPGAPRPPGSALVLDSAAPAPRADAAADAAADTRDILAYLDRLAADELDELLGTYKVSITHVAARPQAPPRAGAVRVFSLTVFGGARLWELRRSEHDFHLLRSKLVEFHGERLLAQMPLPSRRDNSPDETLRYKYEDFLQRLLHVPLLQASALLRLFLSAGDDFPGAAAAALGAAPDLGALVHSVTHKLRKERGQHLETFLRNFLLSADLERYRALKQGGGGVEEAREASEEPPPPDAPAGSAAAARRRELRAARDQLFGDNCGAAPLAPRPGVAAADPLRGFSRCLVYLLSAVLRARGCVTRAAGGLLCAASRALDDAASGLLAGALAAVVSQRRLAHLISLGHGLVFGPRSLPRAEAAQQRRLAQARLRAAVPRALAAALGPSAGAAADAAFRLLQRPHLNKQLVYSLLELCAAELFPELCAAPGAGAEPVRS